MTRLCFVRTCTECVQRGVRATIVWLRSVVFQSSSPTLPKIFVVVEGSHDAAFLRRISAILHAHDRAMPDLAAMERRRELLFVPCGGADGWPWRFRLAGLGRAEFHLCDRDVPPATFARQQALEIVNGRPYCRAAITSKRSLENYLTPDAIEEAQGIRVGFSDDDPVPEVVASCLYQRQPRQRSWQELSARDRKRRRDKAKRWLNTLAVERMTPERLARRDPSGEVRGWLVTIQRLANGIR